MVENNTNIPIVDDWIPEENDKILRNNKDIIIAPVAQIYHVDPEAYGGVNIFWVRPKKSYNSDRLRDHTCHYINYFEKYFDTEKEYLANMANIKMNLELHPEYNVVSFRQMIKNMIIQPSLFKKLEAMVEYNYSLTLVYKSVNTPQLQYTDEHAKALMQISLMMNLCIPLITHFAYMKALDEIDDFLLDIYDDIMYPDHLANRMDIVSKLFETTISNVSKNAKNNALIWNKQDIRGKNVSIHSLGAERNIILNIIPKYTFNRNMVSLNYTSIMKNNKFQITDIQYEFSYVPLSSSKRDGEDNASDFDKFESNLTKADESKFLQNKFNYEYTMKRIVNNMGNNYNPDEISYFKKNLRNENGKIINNFQRQLVFNLFYKFFGDTVSIKAINEDNYVELILAARKMLQNQHLAYLPYVLSGKVVKIVTRKVLNKKEYAEMQNSQYYKLVVEKYKNEKIISQILGMIATIITSSFNIIDYEHQEYTGQPLYVDSKIIIEETLLYTLLV